MRDRLVHNHVWWLMADEFVLRADDEVFAFDDGGTFGWHNGAFGSTSKTTPDGTPTGCESPSQSSSEAHE